MYPVMKEGTEENQLMKSLRDSCSWKIHIDVLVPCDEGGNRSSPAPEEPPGILQLIDQLETIVDTLLSG